MIRPLFLCVAPIVGATAIAQPSEASDGRWVIDLEAASVTQRYNSVRVPADTGSRIDLAKLIGSGARAAGRISVGYTTNNQSFWRLTYAPLTLKGDGRLDSGVSFGGVDFAPGRVEGSYRFNTYRVTYRKPWTGRWSIGGTVMVRDAKIRLEQDGTSSSESNIGFVPLVHIHTAGGIGSGWGYEAEVDLIAGGPGRAIDLTTRLTRRLDARSHAYFGYRVIEGGADVPDVWNFAWVNFFAAGVAVRF